MVIKIPVNHALEHFYTLNPSVLAEIKPKFFYNNKSLGIYLTNIDTKPYENKVAYASIVKPNTNLGFKCLIKEDRQMEIFVTGITFEPIDPTELYLTFVNENLRGTEN